MSKQLDMNRPLDVDKSLNIDEPLVTNELFSEELWVLDLLEESVEEYYYDSHPTQEELTPEASVHARLVRYLVSLLEQLFEGQICAIYDNLNFYHTPNIREHPLAPDLALVRGVSWEDVTSWKVGPSGPPPQVTIEIASKETWKADRKEKVALYAEMGVLEYFVYDPQKRRCWKDTPQRLLGWRWDPATQTMRELIHDEQGRLWSVQLDSWLVPDGSYLRLYDPNNHLRLTGQEAEAEARRAETQRAEAERRRAEIEARRAQTERRRADAEAQARQAETQRAEEERRRADAEAQARQAAIKQAEFEAQRADAERKRAEAEAQRTRVLAEKLRALGINPDEIA